MYIYVYTYELQSRLPDSTNGRTILNRKRDPTSNLNGPSVRLILTVAHSRLQGPGFSCGVCVCV